MILCVCVCAPSAKAVCSPEFHQRWECHHSCRCGLNRVLPQMQMWTQQSATTGADVGSTECHHRCNHPCTCIHTSTYPCPTPTASSHPDKTPSNHPRTCTHTSPLRLSPPNLLSREGGPHEQSESTSEQCVHPLSAAECTFQVE